MPRFVEKVEGRASDLCLYGIAPPKRATPPGRLATIVDRQVARIRELEADGLIVYDIQDEVERVADERPFPFLPTLDPHTYAFEHLEGLSTPKVVYRSVGRDDEASFERSPSATRAKARSTNACSRRWTRVVGSS